MNSVPIKIKRLHPDAVIPTYATTNSAGCDLVAVEDSILLMPNWVVRVRTGLAFEIPEGWEGQIRPRSGLSQQGVRIANAPGTIDADFRGEVCVLMQYGETIQYSEKTGFGTVEQLFGGGPSPFLIKKGMRIAQMVFAPVHRAEFIEVEELTPTARGEGGFGSTGL